MRFMMMAIPEGHGSAAPDVAPSAEVVAKKMEYNKSLQKAGILLAMDGLFPPSTGARISYMDGKPTVIYGPFAESRLLDHPSALTRRSHRMGKAGTHVQQREDRSPPDSRDV
jgi:hypothetical protein